MDDTTLSVTHKRMSAEEAYENVKKLHSLYPNVFMDADEWNRRREEYNKKEVRQ